jgi:hypothetical protein
VAIHSQLQGHPESYWTKESKLRARLIALAIGTLKSPHQKELICAVFGLLCLVGRIAEIAPREDENGHPLPTSDLMGYNALGIVFGPLLIGDLINSYSMKVADPSAGLVLLPVSPPKSRKERHKQRKQERKQGTRNYREKQIKGSDEKEQRTASSSSFTVDKIYIANSITEMLIVHWREIVRQMRNLGALKAKHSIRHGRSCASDMPFRDTPSWNHSDSRSISPYANGRATPSGKIPDTFCHTILINFFPGMETPNNMAELDNPLNQNASKSGVPRQSSSESSQKQFSRVVQHLLSPTVEENPPRQEKTPNHKGISRSLLANRDKHGRSPVSYKQFNKASKTNSQWVIDMSDAIGNGVPAGSDTDIALGHPLSSIRKDKIPLQEAAYHNGLASSRSDTALPHLIRARNTQTVPGTWCPDIAIVPPSSCPETPSIKIQNDPTLQCIHNVRQECLPKSHTEPDMSRRTSPRLSSPPEMHGYNSCESRIFTRSPPSQWKSIIPLGSKRQESSVTNSKRRTPEWKRLLSKKIRPKIKPFLSSPGNENAPEEPNNTNHLTPARFESNTTRSPPTRTFTSRSHGATSRRSASRPMPGAVKAMTALFDHSNVGSLDKCRPDAESLANISRCTPHNASSSEKALRASKSKDNVSQIVSSRPPGDDTPTKSLQNTLRSGRMSRTTRKEPQASTSAEIRRGDHSRPPRLGTMVPYQEEPPVGHFVRPGSATSAPSRHVSISQSMGAITPPRSDSISGLGPRRTSKSSNSFLHAQIRNLQRQLEGRNEEVLQLRRQLEAQENKDIGTLCERLRAAKRECLMWRKRAESAERRMAVFHRFASRFQTLRDDEFDPISETPIDDVIEDSDGDKDKLAFRSYDGKGDDSMASSDRSSIHTETRESLNNRIKQRITVTASTEYGTGGGD